MSVRDDIKTTRGRELCELLARTHPEATVALFDASLAVVAAADGHRRLARVTGAHIVGKNLDDAYFSPVRPILRRMFAEALEGRVVEEELPWHDEQYLFSASQLALAEYAQDIIDADPLWEVVTPAQLGVVTFAAVGSTSEDQSRAAAALSDDGFAARDSVDAQRHADAQSAYRSSIVAKIAELERRQDELLDELGP